jgi:hypothetical protein
VQRNPGTTATQVVPNLCHTQPGGASEWKRALVPQRLRCYNNFFP